MRGRAGRTFASFFTSSVRSNIYSQASNLSTSNLSSLYNHLSATSNQPTGTDTSPVQQDEQEISAFRNK